MVVKADSENKAPDETAKGDSNVSTAKFSGGDIQDYDSAWDDDWAGDYLLASKTDNQLIARGAVLIQQYQRNRTETLRKLAQVVVTLRSKHTYKDMPDWSGASDKYKKCLAEMYRKAGVDRDSESSMQKGLRYHIGVLLRKVAPTEDLKKLGYLEDDANERQKKKAAAGNKTMKGQGKKKDTPLEEVIDARPKNVPVKGGEDPMAHLRIAMFHIEQASKLTVTDDKTIAEVEKSLKTIATATLGWVKKIEDKKAKAIQESAKNAEAKAV